MKNNIDFKEIGYRIASGIVLAVIALAPFVCAVFGAYCCCGILRSICPTLVGGWMVYFYIYLVASVLGLTLTAKMAVNIRDLCSKKKNQSGEE